MAKKVKVKSNNKKNNNIKSRKVIYNYTDYFIRKAIRTGDEHSISINLPKSYSKRLNWVGGETIVKIRIVGNKVCINKVN